jgi:hypothetical protein
MAPDGTSRRARRGREPIERAHVQPEGSAAERGRSPAWLTWIAAAGALVFLSWPQRRLFGDGVLLEGMIGSSPAPYYHVAYVPLGWLVFHGLSPLFRWTALDALEALSGLAGGLALALLARLLARRGLTGWGGRCALALVAASPGMLFFATLGEVHTVQMLGAVLGMSLADAARAAPARRAGWLAAAAVVAPVMFHLSGVALAPCLLALAWGRAPGRGISWRALPGLVLAIALACGVLAVGAWTLARALDPLRALSNPGRLLWVFASELAARLAGRGPFSPAEVWDYLRAEFWTPAGLLLPLALAAFARSRARARRASSSGRCCWRWRPTCWSSRRAACARREATTSRFCRCSRCGSQPPASLKRRLRAARGAGHSRWSWSPSSSGLRGAIARPGASGSRRASSRGVSRPRSLEPRCCTRTIWRASWR